MLQPKNTKYKKSQKGRNKGIANIFINFGKFCMKSKEYGRITSNQIESSRRVISKELKKQGNVWIRIFPDKPITKKPLEVRMGKGKGNVEYWVAIVKPGSIIYEVDCLDENLVRKAFKSASLKLPIKIMFIKKRIYE